MFKTTDKETSIPAVRPQTPAATPLIPAAKPMILAARAAAPAKARAVKVAP